MQTMTAWDTISPLESYAHSHTVLGTIRHPLHHLDPALRVVLKKYNLYICCLVSKVLWDNDELQVHTIFASMMLIVEVYNFMTHLQHQNGPGRCPISEIMAHFHRVIASLTSDALLKSVPGFCTTTLSWIEKLRDRVNFGHTGCDHIPYNVTIFSYTVCFFTV